MSNRDSAAQPKSIVVDAAAPDITGLFAVFKQLHELRARGAIRNVHIDDADVQVSVTFEIANLYRPLVVGKRRKSDFR